ncbi:hypothetical protein [Billgrantia montanilacus]|uniref:Ribbon-helix-helix protein, CopG family n=1 Tax=Billgrantia montanilacus TaxID=2282305 RepID=A0A368U1Q4_9GAMM|nr:hypothetical protein [Halomonas montanilacus]RCV90486.1 hypothetical protein DU505_06000 [Halomonas montanilacus]
MTENMVHLTTRVRRQLIEALDDLAKQRRMQTGAVVRRADLIREALERLTAGDADRQVSRQSDFQALGDGDECDFGTIVLDALEQLADEAERRGIEDVQDMALTLAPTAERDPRTARLRAFVSKLHGTLHSV